ncbi:MAG: CehA/McbA family metallohydrolase [Deltaproteobacteria bacterium]|nr:CehA/McbA family metallohydrolase [Deltaproteobacteria bacterium]
MRSALLLLVAGALVLSGCGDDDTTTTDEDGGVEPDGGPTCDSPPAPLEETTSTGASAVLPVPAGEARAGLVGAGVLPDDPADLLVWEEEDFLLANENVAVVIEAMGASDGYDIWGGNVVGLARVEGDTLVEPANYNEIIRGVGRYTVEPRSIGVMNDGSDGNAAVVRVVGSLRAIPFADDLASGFFPIDYDFIDAAVDYILEPGAESVQVRYTFHNETARRMNGRWIVLAFQRERMPGFVPGAGFDGDNFGEVEWLGYADDGATSYGYGTDVGPFAVLIEVSGTQIIQGATYPIEACGQTEVDMMTIDIGGRGPDGVLAAMRRREGIDQRTITGNVTESDGSPAVGVRVHAHRGDEWLSRVLTDDEGAFSITVPGDEGVTLSTWRTGDAVASTDLGTGVDSGDLQLEENGTIAITAVDQDDTPLPVRVQVTPAGGATAAPATWGEELPFGGRLHLEFPVDGTITLPVPPGNHRVTVSRGFDYELGHDDTVSVSAGEEVAVDAVLDRVIDRTGTLCADYHIHTHRSPDSPDSPEMKLRSAAGDGVDIPCRSDHEWVKEWETIIADLGLDGWMYGPTSLELTTFVFGHFGVVGLDPRPEEPNDGAIPWIGDIPPTVFGRVRALPEDPMLIINHPRGAAISGYFDYVGYDATTGAVDEMDEWDTDFTVVEVFNDSSFDENADETVRDWFSFLRTGRRVFAVGSSDSHKVERGSPVGYPRTCLALGVDDAPTLRAGVATQGVLDATRAGQFVVDGGIFLTALARGDVGPGGDLTGAGATESVQVTVQAPSWIDATELEVWIDGELAETISLGAGDGVLRFDEAIDVAIDSGGSWVVFHARGEMPLDPVHPGRMPFGVTQPIFFQP